MKKIIAALVVAVVAVLAPSAAHADNRAGSPCITPAVADGVPIPATMSEIQDYFGMKGTVNTTSEEGAYVTKTYPYCPGDKRSFVAIGYRRIGDGRYIGWISVRVIFTH